jgi:predicted nicotinamide N-methyase
VSAISEARWQVAQQHEAAWWAKFRASLTPDHLAVAIADGHHFTAGVLDIRPATITGSTVLDIAGGPYPLASAVDAYHIKRYVVVDPADYPEADGVRRVKVCAEDYTGEGATEVWGYNVLQHVRDPAAVMQKVRARAHERIRWFDVVDTPIYPVHPHSITADWLRGELSRDGFRIARDIDGSRLVEGARQKWVALVAERS